MISDSATALTVVSGTPGRSVSARPSNLSPDGMLKQSPGIELHIFLFSVVAASIDTKRRGVDFTRSMAR